jgi:hypothetical protein
MNHQLTRCLTEKFFFYQKEITLPFYVDKLGRLALRHKDYDNMFVKILTNHKRITDETKSLDTDDIALSANHYMVIQIRQCNKIGNSTDDYYQIVFASKSQAYKVMNKKLCNSKLISASAAIDVPDWDNLTEQRYDELLYKWVEQFDSIRLPPISMSIQTPVV